MQPQQQSALGGITQCDHISGITVVKECGRVAGYTLLDKLAGSVVGEFIAIGQAVEMSLVYLHFVLGERARLVGTDDRCGAHGLTSVHTAHQIVVLQHLAHTQRQRQGDAHRQTLGYRDHNQCDGKHDRLNKILGIGDKTLATAHNILNNAAQHQQSRHDIAATGDGAPEAVKLLGKRGLNVIVNLSIAIHLAVFCLVAHAVYPHGGAALDDGAGAQQDVNGIGCLVIFKGRVMAFPCRRLASERAFVDGKVVTVDNGAIGRDSFSGFKDDDIPHHDVTPRHLGDVAITHDLDLDVIVGLIKQAEFLVGIDLYQETYQRGKHHGYEDAQGFKEDAHAHIELAVLIYRHSYRQG